ncbi:Signal transduction response regulator, receiver region domain protein [Candidatus Omnitrophus magneticus]|uniref:Signal transduction response regulator, receiver region domain protein n=1 Tax=Candidatus Omnitrophus magneticus TaxID=1609969 RepID=A0A0F0CUN9_9BACT|nr:Signal transduction response regulator, receiver region domain protein [Candidatus Omnitrophus magneticus]
MKKKPCQVYFYIRYKKILYAKPKGVFMKKVLIVDDEREYLLLFGEQLRTMGYSVVGAMNGKCAISMAKREKPDVVMLDMMLPDMDGVSIARNLKSDKETKNIPIIFVSGVYYTPENKDDAFEDASFILTKPVKMKELITVIGKLTSDIPNGMPPQGPFQCPA